jgi:amino acid adenylation domain-containing protein
VEQAIANSWQELLNIEKVGTNDNFFELGGHSLMAMRVIAAIRRELNVELNIKDIFLHPTLEALAAHVQLQSNEALLPALEVQARPEYIPLSFGQERLWFIDQLEGSVQYHLPSVLRLKGNLVINELEHAFQTIVNRHEVLRTVILEKNGMGYQFILNENEWRLDILDGAVYKNNPETLQQRLRELVNQPFDLSKDHLVRASLMNLDEQEHLLVVTMHHIVSDAWSMSVIVKEIVELYSAYAENRFFVLPMLPVQYADYAIWQRNYLQGDLLTSKLNYWKENLEGVAPLLLPVDHTRPSIWSNRGAIARFSINKELSTALKLLSRQQESTLFMTVLAAFKVLLHRYSGQQDIVVGTSVANRTRKEMEGLIGFFVNMLALRSDVNDELSFTELLQEVKATTLAAYEHQDVPFEKVVDVVVKERDMSRNPLVQVMLIFLNTPEVPELRLGDITLSIEESQQTKTLFDLSFYVNESPDGMEGWVAYCTDLFNGETISRMIGNFQQLLLNIVADPRQTIGAIPIITEPEKQQLLIDFIANESLYPKEKSIVDLFEEQVLKTPNAVALVFGDSQLTYKELNEQSNRVAHYLKSRNVQRETMVPICIERSLDLIIGILGILKAGGAYVPLDPQYPQERINYMLNDVSAQILLCSNHTKTTFAGLNHTELVVLDNNPLFANQPAENLGIQIQPNNLAYVIYTSGSTGKPKGVMIEHHSVVSLVKAVDYVSLSNEDILLSTGSSSFDATTFEYYGMLLNGGRLILCNEDRLLDNELLKEEIIPRKVNKMWFTSSWFNQLVDTDITVFKGLETLLVGGEKLSEQHVQKIRRTYPGVKVINGYGPTENTTFSLTYTIEETEIDHAIPIGKPLNNRGAYILDSRGELVPVGVTGEICLNGAGIARGYLNNEDLTRQKFVSDPFAKEAGARMYKTGDLGRWLPMAT